MELMIFTVMAIIDWKLEVQASQSKPLPCSTDRITMTNIDHKIKF